MNSKINKTKKSRTKTSDFGSSGRYSHDSTKFYSSKLYNGADIKNNHEYFETPISKEITNRIFHKSSEIMSEVPDSSVHLMITSPPYNVGKIYDEDMSLDDYRSFIRKIMKEVYRCLVPGGRICLNIANLGRKPYIPLEAYITEDLISLGFLMRGQIIWDKSTSAGSSTAWGSWLSASNPTLRDVHEYILIFSKGEFSRKKLSNRDSTIDKNDFLELSKSIWRFTAESAKRIGHPAPFPIELVRRCIELFSFSNEVILDPFMGSGSTAIAALKSGRRFIGYEINSEYIELSNKRINN